MIDLSITSAYRSELNSIIRRSSDTHSFVVQELAVEMKEPSTKKRAYFGILIWENPWGIFTRLLKIGCQVAVERAWGLTETMPAHSPSRNSDSTVCRNATILLPGALSMKSKQSKIDG